MLWQNQAIAHTRVIYTMVSNIMFWSDMSHSKQSLETIWYTCVHNQ